MKTKNYWKTSDISLHKDSQGAYDAEHTYQGTLFEMEFFNNRREARQEAVKILKELEGEL